MNKRKVETLAKYMDEMPRREWKHFDMRWFVRKGNGFDGKSVLTGCGTTACALGFATQIPSFRRAGLRLNEGYMPAFLGSDGLEAAGAFFEPDAWQAHHLFGLFGFIDTPKKWAKYAREFLEEQPE